MKLFSKKSGSMKIENVENELKVIDKSLKKLMQELLDIQVGGMSHPEGNSGISCPDPCNTSFFYISRLLGLLK